MIRRFIVLLRFEIRKILSQKKALLFLLALNVVPLLASLFSFLAYIKFKGWGIANIEFSVLLQLVKGLFTAHMKFFSFISPFFLSLLIGDSFSGEAGRGHLKTLLLTPIPRWMVPVAKGASIMIFLLIAAILGGFFLQMNLWVARALTDNPSMIMDIREAVSGTAPGSVSATLVETSTALQLFLISLIINLTLVSFFLFFSLWFESPILMTFTSLIVLMAIQTFSFMGPYLGKLDDRYEKMAEWCFTRPLSKLSDLDTITGLLDKKLDFASRAIAGPVTASLAWTAFFLALTFFFFQRKEVLH